MGKNTMMIGVVSVVLLGLNVMAQSPDSPVFGVISGDRYIKAYCKKLADIPDLGFSLSVFRTCMSMEHKAIHSINTSTASRAIKNRCNEVANTTIGHSYLMEDACIKAEVKSQSK